MDVGLYLHFPFCVRKCRYCDFLSFPADENTKKVYASQMIREIRGYEKTLAGRTVSSIFLGGGTPSLMPPGSLKEIFRALYDCFDVSPKAEITMEVNPGTLSEKVLFLIGERVNRVSLGAQSFRDEELKYLGRIHSAREAENSFRRLRDAGVANINLDLMSGIPLQTEESLAESLRAAASLRPEHISCYSLIVEEGTPFHSMQQQEKLPLPDEEAERRFYYLTRDFLENEGYHRYEISNFAREGCECRHNLRYWRRGDYIGFGLGAASLFNHTRWRNTRSLSRYLRDANDPGKLVREMEQLDKKSEIEEYMFLGLRTQAGISTADFEMQFGLPAGDIYGDVLKDLTDQGLLETADGTYLRLTDRGIDVSNRVLAMFLLD